VSSAACRVRNLGLVLVFALAPYAFGEQAAGPETGVAGPVPTPMTADAVKAMPPWMQPEVVKSAVQINMNDEQKAEFRRLVGNYISDRVAMIQQVVSRGGMDLEKTIKTKDRRLQKELDEQMKVVLTKEQWPKYEDYKKVLKSKLKG